MNPHHTVFTQPSQMFHPADQKYKEWQKEIPMGLHRDIPITTLWPIQSLLADLVWGQHSYPLYWLDITLYPLCINSPSPGGLNVAYSPLETRSLPYSMRPRSTKYLPQSLTKVLWHAGWQAQFSAIYALRSKASLHANFTKEYLPPLVQWTINGTIFVPHGTQRRGALLVIMSNTTTNSTRAANSSPKPHLNITWHRFGILQTIMHKSLQPKLLKQEINKNAWKNLRIIQALLLQALVFNIEIMH